MAEWLEGEVDATGITTHYYRSDGRNKPSILLLHGFTDNGLCWSRVAHELEGSYDVVMTDARGHGGIVNLFISTDELSPLRGFFGLIHRDSSRKEAEKTFLFPTFQEK